MSDEGLIDVIYHPVAFLDRLSQGTAFSTRSGSTAALIAEEAPDKFVAFHNAMFANQPAEGTRGLSDKDLQGIATEVGVPADVVAKIPSYAYSQWMAGATEKANVAGVAGTPTIFINGVSQSADVNPEGVNWSQPGALRAAVEAAAAQ
jgi:protein-disulfide isomerase